MKSLFRAPPTASAPLARIAAGLLLASALPAGAATLNVPGDHVTIQAAVTAAASGDTILIGAGSFPEQVRIDKSLVIMGSGTGATTILAPGALTGDLAIVTVTGATTGAEIRDLTIAGPGPSTCGGLKYGILVRDDSYAHIHDNIIRDIRDNPLSGCIGGTAVQVGRSSLNSSGTADIHDNEIFAYQRSGIFVGRTGSSANITGNTITGAGPTSVIGQNGIQVGHGATAGVVCNVVTGNRFTPQTAASSGILDTQSGNAIPLFILDNILEDNDVNTYLIDSGCGEVCTNSAATALITGNSYSGATSYGGVSDALAAVIVSGAGGVFVSAEDNWWGAADGPSDQGPGSGDGVAADPSNTIDFEPFLTADPDADDDDLLPACGDVCLGDADNDSDADGYCVATIFDPPMVGGSDNCPSVANPTQADADGDLTGDACDACTDLDGDGAGDPGFAANTCATDNCLALANPTQADADADGLGDACDTCTDADGDGFGDPGATGDTCASDNCPLVQNPNQTDGDGDGLGDACDDCTDTDGDGFGDPDSAGNTCPEDNCPLTSNPGQGDTDSDGIGDACDSDTSPSSLVIQKARLRMATRSDKPNGTIILRAIVSDGDSGGTLLANLSGGTVSLDVSDGGVFDRSATLSNCAVRRDDMNCRSSDSSVVARFNSIGPDVYRVKVRIKDLTAAATGATQPIGPVSVVLNQGLFVRADDISACQARGKVALACRD